MPVIVKYTVERNGVERMTFTSKQEADAYDKMLDTADLLQQWLVGVQPDLTEETAETLSLAMAKQREELTALLSGKTPKAKTPLKPEDSETSVKQELSLVANEKAA